MIACICRQIYEEDHPDAASLQARIMESDWRCGQCQLRYELALIAERPNPVNSKSAKM